MAWIVARGSTGALGGSIRALAAHLPNRAASWALLTFSCGTALSAALQRVLPTSNPGWQRLVELNVGELFAIAAVASLLITTRKSRPALTPVDLAVVVICALTWFAPEPHAVYAGMTVAAIWLITRPYRDRLIADIGQIWLALCLCELWSKLAFKLLYQGIEPFEVQFMAWVGRFAYPDLRATGVYLSTHPEWSIVMLDGCSAFHNLSLAALIWLCLLKVAGRRPGAAECSALATSAVLVVAINVARILAMLPSPTAYHFWHDETGSVAVALASITASIVPIVILIERTRCPAARRV
ncbi:MULTISPECIES: hypothetical protein [unclassified Methylobacterium]|uniref:hypothetical protein n=1 Tax=unclassified Methylobacterium TaxID=2615210 RepID=UPI00226A57AA|nr:MULTISPECIES: hypothetical protein [unclassified Methylobacterium]